jgi:hypothetical protein
MAGIWPVTGLMLIKTVIGGLLAATMMLSTPEDTW